MLRQARGRGLPVACALAVSRIPCLHNTCQTYGQAIRGTKRCDNLHLAKASHVRLGHVFEEGVM